ncbi:hypothetical protein [Streptomyces violarus]|uniref:hypothetical protein n=1 Tax=Streptomyces violarus TaxID=67380 RepID=UPI0021C16AD3|nr:hypothetical protein [Streptomyces violarus]MCT9142948.1 hypothetical protein [Streptomyces violarus]
MLGDHPEAVEADLAHQYPEYGPGGPLAAYWRGEITLRWLRVMVENLPPTGATARANNGHAWQAETYAAADSRDLLALLFTAFVNANRDPKKPPMAYPEPGWRPGDPTPEESAAAAERDRAKARTAYEHITAQVLPGEG